LGDGDGGTYYDPWTDLDVVAHEYSHGIYQDEVGNNYNGEPGTIQEALSDIWAACVENYVSLPNHDPWVMFDGFEKTGVHRRSLADPSSNQYHYHPTPYSSGVHYPDVYLGDYWYTGTADYGGVHWNSTVFSHWFYLLSQGGSDTNSEGVCYNISPIGITDAAKIVYLMETAYLTENSTFTDARTLSIYVATNLFGANSNQVVQTTNAWHAVGVGNVYQHYISGPNLICQPSSHDYSIENLTPGYTITWNPGPNVTRISPPGSNPCTFSFSGSGSKSIGATINSTCYSSQTIPQHNVWLGIPDFDYISGPNPPISYKGYTGQPYTFWTYPARDPDSQSSYQWMVVPPEYDWYFTYQYYDWATIVFNDPYDYYQVMCRATNTCGATNWQYKQVAIMQGYYFSMFPNPASDIVTVDLIGPTENIENLEKPFDFDVQILDYSGILHYSAKKSGDSFTIPVSNLKDGSYTVRITYGKEVENLPLIIKH
jgi:hypothetical protein